MDNNYSQPIISESGSNQVIVTILFNGTCSSLKAHAGSSDTFPNGETISVLRTQMCKSAVNLDECVRYNKFNPNVTQYYVGLDGPGSGNIDASKRTIAPSTSSQILQTALGKGVEENVLCALKDIEILQRELKKQGKTMKVNLAGWSRGAASCIYLANKMFKDSDLKHIPVNIFANDPVPGIGNVHAENCMLTPNVKNACLVYSRDEESFGFSPVIPMVQDHEATTATYLDMPGHHATLVGNPEERASPPDAIKLNLVEVGLITRWMNEQFLLKHGTKFQPTTPNFTHKELLVMFEKIQKDLPLYEKFREVSYLGRRQLAGDSRKATLGNLAWTNQTFNESSLFTGFNTDKDKLNIINSLHRFLIHHPGVEPLEFFDPREIDIVDLTTSEVSVGGERIMNLEEPPDAEKKGAGLEEQDTEGRGAGVDELDAGKSNVDALMAEFQIMEETGIENKYPDKEELEQPVTEEKGAATDAEKLNMDGFEIVDSDTETEIENKYPNKEGGGYFSGGYFGGWFGSNKPVVEPEEKQQSQPPKKPS